MLRRRILVGLLATMLILSFVPGLYAASAVVHVTTRVRAKVSVTVAERNGTDILLVKANIPWTVATQETDPGGVRFGETFSGERTTDSGTLVPTAGRIEGFTVLGIP